MNTESPSNNTSPTGIKTASAETAQTVKDEAMKLGASAKQAGESMARDKAEDVRGHLATRSDSVESAVSDMASTVNEHSATLGEYANEFADSIATFNDRLKTSSLDQLAGDARRVARDNPAMFMLGAVAIGAIAARFFQASSSGNHQSRAANIQARPDASSAYNHNYASTTGYGAPSTSTQLDRNNLGGGTQSNVTPKGQTI